ncbi:MAG: hypothetical protein NW207_00555 [Cytophagales bacterium]|nr:hypothetical protein [Cytophagales bacterium]
MLCFSIYSFSQDQLATWDFAGKGGQSVVNATNLYANVLSGTASVGPGLYATNYLDNGLTASDDNQTTLNGAISKAQGGQYFSVHIVPAMGYQLHITGLHIRPISQNRTRTFAVLSNISGYESGQVLGTFTSESQFNGDIQQVALSGFTHITSAVEFRIYVYSAANPNVYEAVGIGNGAGLDLVVHGTVSPIPVVPSWSTQGNTLTGSEFIGSTHAQDVVLKTNNTERVRIGAAGNTSITGTLHADNIQLTNSVIHSLTTNGITFTGSHFDLYTPVQAQWNGNKPLMSFSQYGEANFYSTPYLNYNSIYLKGTGDYRSGIRYTDAWGTATGIGGIALFGEHGGVLGSKAGSWDGPETPALSWDKQQNVRVHGNMIAPHLQFTSTAMGITFADGYSLKSSKGLLKNGDAQVYFSESLDIIGDNPMMRIGSLILQDFTVNNYVSIPDQGSGGLNTNSYTTPEAFVFGNIYYDEVAQKYKSIFNGDYYNSLNIINNRPISTTYTSNNGGTALRFNSEEGSLEFIAIPNTLSLSFTGVGVVLPSEPNGFNLTKDELLQKRRLIVHGSGLVEAPGTITSNTMVADNFIVSKGIFGTISGNDLTVNKLTVHTPLNTLTVNGVLTCLNELRGKGIYIDYTGTWPDYVFDANYKLTSLDTLKKYININKHLPDVPSQNELKNKGLDLVKMNEILLKKIEELTLHIISQQEQIETIKSKLK